MSDRKRWTEPLGTPTQTTKQALLNQPLTRTKEVGLAGYSLLFSEIVRYNHMRVKTTTELENRLSEIGCRIGRRALDLVSVREKTAKRETTLIGILGFVMKQLWKALFGKHLEELRRATNSQSCYYIDERDPLVNKFVSIPQDFGSFNCAAFAAGIIAGVLDSAGFPAKVNAYFTELTDRPYKPLTLYYIDFETHVIERDKEMERKRA